MTLNSVVWANALSGITPIAKLVALHLAGGSGAEEIGSRNIEDLGEFACCTPGEVREALSELAGHLPIKIVGERVEATFPTREDETERAAYWARHEASKANRPSFLYVISKGGKIKIGMSQRLSQRLQALRTSFPLPTDVLLTVKGPFRAIRRAEMHTHEALKDAALGGEYFDVSTERALGAVRLALQRNGIPERCSA